MAAKLIVNHFSHYIRESQNTTIVYTDNQPLQAAYKRLKQGEFSNSSRIASFLTSMCVHDIEIRYFPGKDQKVGDFYSRNPIPCENSDQCQICQFAFKEQDMHPPKMFIASVEEGNKSTVNMVTYEDVINGKMRVPFTERPAWVSVQADDQVHDMLSGLIKRGQKPEKKRQTGTLQSSRNYTTYIKMGCSK